MVDGAQLLVESTTFSKHGWGYDPKQVDAFQEAIRDTFIRGTQTPGESTQRPRQAVLLDRRGSVWI
jgi:hypothetical protein